MTHTKAIELFKSGNIEAAWAVAKMDEGLNEGVTFEVWVKFAQKCVDNQYACDAAYEASF